MREKRKIPARATIKVDTYRVVARAVEEGINAGWNRAHKHAEEPREEHIKQEIESAIMLALDEIISWQDPHGEESS
jgi:hypothetical protein